MQAAALVMVMVLLPADAPASPDGPPPAAAVRVEDSTELQGRWEVVGCVVNGRDTKGWYKGDKWVFAGSLAVMTDVNGMRQYVQWSVRADPIPNPSHIEIVVEDGVMSRRGIYRRSGDDLLWAYDVSGIRRPSSFEPAPEVWVWTLRRVRK
jgi:uncharacterized protein (TIGR03067 family)